MTVPDPRELDTTLLLTRLLCTRLCHDLAGPIGAVAAGIELAGNDPSQVDHETLTLIGTSSAAASQKLKFLRAALGAPAAPTTNGQDLFAGFLAAISGPDRTPVLEWPNAQSLAAFVDELTVDAMPLIFNLCLLVVEALPACGRFELQVASPANISAAAHVEKPRAPLTWRADILDAVGARQKPLTAKTIQASFAKHLAESCGGRLVLEAAPTMLRASFQRAAP